MDQNNFEPDIISNTPQRRNIITNRRRRSEYRRTVQSSEAHSRDSRKCGTHGHSHQRHSRSNSCHRYHHAGDNANYSFRRHQNGYDITYGLDDCSSYHQNRELSVHTVDAHNDNSRLIDIENDRSPVIPEIDRSLNPLPLSSVELISNQRNDCFRELSNQRPAVTCRMANHRVRSSSQEVVCDTPKSRNDVPNSRANVQIGHENVELDCEITKDIVRTLRIIGDDLDAQMRQFKEPFHHVVLDAIMVNTGRVLLMTVKQLDLVGVAIDASLALVKFIRQ